MRRKLGLVELYYDRIIFKKFSLLTTSESQGCFGKRKTSQTEFYKAFKDLSGQSAVFGRCLHTKRNMTVRVNKSAYNALFNAQVQMSISYSSLTHKFSKE